MDVHSKGGWPAAALSNFAPHPFQFDGVDCASMEGLLQAFKVRDPDAEAQVCRLAGMAAKKAGSGRNWQRRQQLHWRGQTFDRKGRAYQALLDRAFWALFTQNAKARRALLATGDASLTHMVGKRKPAETVLTRSEFTRRLHTVRAELRG